MKRSSVKEAACEYAKKYLGLLHEDDLRELLSVDLEKSFLAGVRWARRQAVKTNRKNKP